MSDEAMRATLSREISDFMFSSFQWASSRGNLKDEPKMHKLSVDLLEYQRLNHPLYGRYCELNHCTKRGSSILDYPPLPVESFKRADLGAFDRNLTTAEFHSSGTTEGTASVHRYRDISLLQRTLMYSFTQYICHHMMPSTRFFSLMPSYNDNPHSSLGFMLAQFVETLGSDGSGFYFSKETGLDVDRLAEDLERAQKEGVAVHLMGPAFSHVELLDRLGTRKLCCAPGSCILETGGYKGKSREVPKGELRALLSSSLGIERGHIYGEYGMCELSSQGYEICALNTEGNLPDECLYTFPGWLRCLVMNPDTMNPILPGNEGQIAFFDACNLDSAAYILTGDIGTLIELPEEMRQRMMGKPKYALRLKGRSPQAVPKGCSLSWEEWNQHAKSRQT